MPDIWLRISPESGTYKKSITVHAVCPEQLDLFLEIDKKVFPYTNPISIENDSEVIFILRNVSGEILYTKKEIYKIESEILKIENSEFILKSETTLEGKKLKASDVLLEDTSVLTWTNNNREFKLTKKDIDSWPKLNCLLKIGIKYKLNNPIELNLIK